MKAMTTTLMILIGLLTLSAPSRANPVVTPRIQLALLLDTSNSMDGLISQAKTQLWKVVNEFATAEREGLRPGLEVALYEYGKSSLVANEGYIRMILPLTNDLDAVSEELFSLTTNGGAEYCGWVIQDAVADLAWSRYQDDLKAIFIAGNEPFTQGGVDYRSACQHAIEAGIVVNTIHCGGYDEGISGHWKDGALLADGMYMHIDQNQVLAHIDAPQDDEIRHLGGELNNTYIPYGLQGEARAELQVKQDRNAQVAAPAAATERMLFKSSGHYKNANWDLVDALEEGVVEIEELDEEILPEEMRAMSPEERTVYVAEQSSKRAEIQAEIKKLRAEREVFIAEKMKEQVREGEETLDEALIRALREQAEARKFEFKKDQP